MAAKVASGTQGSAEKEQCPGVSYASILNPKSGTETRVVNKGNNKENIGSQVVQQQSVPIKDCIAPQNLTVKGKSYQRTGRRINSQSKIEKRYGNELPTAIEQNQLVIQKENLVEERQEATVEQMNGDIGSDGEFQTVAPKSARRKEKLKEQRDFRERQKHRDHRHPLRGHTGSNERSYKERDRGDRGGMDHVVGNKDVLKDKEETEAESEIQSSAPVKYVEAPLPAVNPWTKSKIITPVTPANFVATVPSGTVVSMEKQIDKEKRVLQPQQQQGIVGECQYSFVLENIYMYYLYTIQVYVQEKNLNFLTY